MNRELDGCYFRIVRDGVELGDILEEQSRQLLMDDLAIGQTAGEENGWIPAEDVRQHFAERI